MTLRTLYLKPLLLLAAGSFWVEAASVAPDPATIYAWFKADAGTVTSLNTGTWQRLLDVPAPPTNSPVLLPVKATNPTRFFRVTTPQTP